MLIKDWQKNMGLEPGALVRLSTDSKKYEGLTVVKESNLRCITVAYPVELLKVLLPKHDQIMKVIVRYSPEGREPVTKESFWVHMDTATALLHAWRMLGSMYWDIQTGWVYGEV